MNLVRRLLIAAALSAAVDRAPLQAQDLFELEVFDTDTTPAGRFGLELHANGLSGGGVATDSFLANHRPVHLSIEIARGWTSRLETAVFLQTAPFGRAGSVWFAGGHVKTIARLGELSSLPIRFGVSAEYAFNRAAFDGEIQTFEMRSLVDYERGRLTLNVNPAFEIVTRGSEDGLEPVFDISARAAWRLNQRASVSVDYFSAAATVRHLQPEPEAHHLIFGGVELALGGAWGLEMGAGHCVIRDEPWVMKSVLSYGF